MHDNSYLLPRDAKARTILKPFRLKHNRMWPPTLRPLSWGRYRASANELKLDTIVNNIATREGEETVESSRPKRNQFPLPCKKKTVCRFAGGSRKRAVVGVLMHDNSYLLPRNARAGTILKPFPRERNQCPCPNRSWNKLISSCQRFSRSRNLSNFREYSEVVSARLAVKAIFRTTASIPRGGARIPSEATPGGTL